MSEQCFTLVPAESRYVPAPAQIENALRYWQEISPVREAEELSLKEHPLLRNAGEIETITCPFCGTELNVSFHPLSSEDSHAAWWSEFVFFQEIPLLEATPRMPCCGMESETDSVLSNCRPQGTL